VYSTSSTSLPSSTHVNPILLLPVSLNANQGPGLGTHRSDMSGLSLFTLHASPDLFNCIGLNKSIVNHTNLQQQWNSSNYSLPVVSSTVDKLKEKIKNNRYSKNIHDHFTNKPIDEPQIEPLNLKIGETTVPSFQSSSTKPKVAYVQPMNTTYTVTQQSSKADSIKLIVKRSTSMEPKSQSFSKPHFVHKTKSHRRKSRASPVSFEKSSKQHHENDSLKLVLKRTTSTDPKKDYSSNILLANDTKSQRKPSPVSFVTEKKNCETDALKLIVKRSTSTQSTKDSSTNSILTPKMKPQRRKSRASPVNTETATKQLPALALCKKRHSNSPSPGNNLIDFVTASVICAFSKTKRTRVCRFKANEFTRIFIFSKSDKTGLIFCRVM